MISFRSLAMHSSNKTILLLNKLNHVLYICGLPYFWIGDLDLSENFTKFYNQIIKWTHWVMFFFIFVITGALFTQKELTDKQISDQYLMVVVSPGLMFFYENMLWYRADVKDLLYRLAVLLKSRYNEKDLERDMIRKLKLQTISFLILVTVVLSLTGLVAFIDMITLDKTFTAVITVWPDINDRSPFAGVARVAFYIMWWLFSLRTIGTFVLLLTIMTSISFQYRNLQRYFYSLDNIFYDDGLDQSEKERIYEQQFKLGIYMHTLTLWSTDQYELVCNKIFGLEMIMCLFTLVSVLPPLLNNGHELSTLFEVIPTGAATLLSLGFFMWNAGDITVEASCLSEAMYASGWQNCFGKSSIKIRKLVVTAMAQAQNPVVLQAFGIIDLSYETYMTVVKTSYSIVSVFY